MFTNVIKSALEKNKIDCREDLYGKLSIYLSLLKEWNQRMDLTAVTDDHETIDKHFIDSLSVLKCGLISHNSLLIDVGTGAGFPGLVLAMARPDLHVTLLDSQQKRLNFIQCVCDNTGTSNTQIFHLRAEEGARKPELREHFDYAVARAVAPLNVLCEYLLPFVKVSGYALCWKGPALKDEMECGRRAARLLGGRLEMPFICHLEGRDWEHTILPVQKIQKTDPIYPRKAGIPKAKPLGI